MTNRDRRDRLLFTVAAAWNVAIAVPFLLAESQVRALLQLPPTGDKLVSQLFFVCVLGLGLGYGIVGRDPSKNHGIVLIGALIKAAVFAITLTYFLRGDVGAASMGAPVGDLVFAVLFTEFLMSRRSV